MVSQRGDDNELVLLVDVGKAAELWGVIAGWSSRGAELWGVNAGWSSRGAEFWGVIAGWSSRGAELWGVIAGWSSSSGVLMLDGPPGVLRWNCCTMDTRKSRSSLHTKAY